jgi:hypothetical protein
MAILSTRAVFQDLRERWQRLLRRHRSLAELAACPPRELEHIARDAGVSVSDLRIMATAHPGPSDLLPQRLALLGLDPAYVKFALTGTYRDLERTCAMCTSWRRCARDLANGDVQAGMAATVDALTVGRARPAQDMTCAPWLPMRQPMPWPMHRRVERRAVRMRADAAPRRRSRQAGAAARRRCLCRGAREVPRLQSQRRVPTLARCPIDRRQAPGVLPQFRVVRRLQARACWVSISRERVRRLLRAECRPSTESPAACARA